ncbi:unnamed protein product [Rhizophagus irregularis]|nr:unnamed protein product [Rhizophagus irregularis]
MWPDNCDTLEISCTNFYSTYQNWCSEKGENKTLSDNKFGMEIKQLAPKTRPRRSGTREYCYILDKAKIAKNFSKVIQSTQVGQEEVELVVEKPAEEKLEEPAPEADDDYDVLEDLLSDSDSTPVDPAPEQQPESSTSSESFTSSTKSEPLVDSPVPEEQSIPEPDTESEIDRDPEPKQGTKAHWAWYERHRWDRKPWVKNSKNQTFSDLYNTGKDLWAKYQDASDEYDWEILAFEVEESPTTRIEDEYQYYLREVVDRFKDWVEYNGDSPKAPSRKELADLIRVYKEDRNAEIIPTPSGHETMRLNKGKAREDPEEHPKTDMEREWEAANGLVDELDIDEACDMFDSI